MTTTVDQALVHVERARAELLAAQHVIEQEQYREEFETLQLELGISCALWYVDESALRHASNQFQT